MTFAYDRHVRNLKPLKQMLAWITDDWQLRMCYIMCMHACTYVNYRQVPAVVRTWFFLLLLEVVEAVQVLFFSAACVRVCWLLASPEVQGTALQRTL